MDDLTSKMRILAIVSGEYGNRHVVNIQQHGSAGWNIATWQAPAILPPVIDYPEDYLPDNLPPVDLILSFAEHRGCAELLPDLARLTGARGVVAPIDNEAWLPRGLARQLRGWLENIGVTCVTPKPLCSLTERDYMITRRQRIAYHNPWIEEFARKFGQPDIQLTIDGDSRTIISAEVRRDTVCGCARFVASKLVGLSVDEAEQEAGMAHHHYPCLASMGIDSDFNDTLMHVSGNILRDQISHQVKPYKTVQYFTPGILSEDNPNVPSRD